MAQDQNTGYRSIWGYTVHVILNYLKSSFAYLDLVYLSLAIDCYCQLKSNYQFDVSLQFCMDVQIEDKLFPIDLEQSEIS